MNISNDNDHVESSLYELKAESKLDEAREVLAAAAESNTFAAKLELARFLRQTPALSMPQKERFAKAEKLYKSCMCQLDLPSVVTAEIAHELALLYSVENRPLACLGFLLKARRHGAKISDDELEKCKKQLHKIDINSPGNAQDAFVLGRELYLVGTADAMAEYFLRVAADSNDLISGVACLTLADHYDRLSKDNPVYKKEALQYYQLAKERDILTISLPAKKRKRNYEISSEDNCSSLILIVSTISTMSSSPALIPQEMLCTP